MQDGSRTGFGVPIRECRRGALASPIDDAGALFRSGCQRARSRTPHSLRGVDPTVHGGECRLRARCTGRSSGRRTHRPGGRHAGRGPRPEDLLVGELVDGVLHPVKIALELLLRHLPATLEQVLAAIGVDRGRGREFPHCAFPATDVSSVSILAANSFASSTVACECAGVSPVNTFIGVSVSSVNRTFSSVVIHAEAVLNILLVEGELRSRLDYSVSDHS